MTTALALTFFPGLVPAREEDGVADIAAVDTIIPEHGKYTTAYMSDWSKLPTGDKIPRRDPAGIEFKPVVGETMRREWANQEKVYLADLELRVTWEAKKSNKRTTTLFRIIDCKEVIIENLAIIQSDPDFRGYHTIAIEGADRVIIRNLYLAGTVQSHHLRLEGCKDILIDNVEIAGVDYLGNGRTRVGGGIWINNGATGTASSPMGLTGLWIPPEHVRMPGWQIVQNCYFHGGLESDGGDWRNQDALLIHHPGNGVLFNCVVENWFHPPMDGGFDLSYRRTEPEYQDKFFRIERNVVRNVTFGIKTPARSPGPNVLFFANNLLVNSQLADYHNGAANDVYYVHNTYIYDTDQAPPALREMAQRGASGYASLWRYSALSVLSNSLLYKPSGPFTLFYGNHMGQPDKYLYLKPDYNVYALGSAKPIWYRNSSDGVKFKTLDDWRNATGTDGHSAFVNASAVQFVDYAKGDYRLRSNPAPTPDTLTTRYLSPADARMRVDRDFYGKSRSASDVMGLSPGAFCVEK
ncbi:hypothetical protein [Geminisphaera colitermitum]|uniref:hypothetical protein n=1 Tax=Geminisphaera colitermitum TaxID=1148786 RepID=UPI0002F5EF59|nr:hypothetical protein [Geminisphaera colitermitum]